jgi:streptogramin lyase
MHLQTSVLCSLWIAGVAFASGIASRPLTRTSAVGDLNVKIREWDVPTKGAHPHDPAVAPDGSLWFTEQMVSKLGRLDPATGDFKEYPLQGKNDGPHGLVADSDGNIWYTISPHTSASLIRVRAKSLSTRCRMRRRKIRTRLFSTRMERSGSPYRSGTWWAASIQKPEK